ncbi:carbohydrate kinase family protein [Agromyces sp. Soil535]|uniref:carbohydrate kinase family protein n=1 Tax=Agromyces sp. Soil535 TaxID=1736390 RepID=UPI0006FF2300|nr:PfkB family carbohydrate kinase [Agromyces sp. Soil535]KRE20944.1 carbohydrate kinase [Agromyces sp. Soil535]
MRDDDSDTIGLLAVGQLFTDFVYSGLPAGPQLGEEIWTDSFGFGPGGIANFAIAATRLGMSSSVVAALGDDAMTELCSRMLAAEGVDLGHCRVVDGWSLPVTSSLGWAGDRALVTGGTPAPLGADALLDAGVPAATTAVVHLDPEPAEWLPIAAAQGTRVYADLGWDPSGAWNRGILDQLTSCAAFLPNELEALSYTGTDSAGSAADALAERVPLCVVTLGSLGVIAIDSTTGERVERPALDVLAIDPTGAGDVFGAALAYASTRPWTLTERIDFACLCAGITVSRPGGAAGAPRLSELDSWLRTHPNTFEPHRYDFLVEQDSVVITSAPSSQPD